MNVRVLQAEARAIGRTALWWPSRFVAARRPFDPNAPHPTPVVFVHGLFGDPTNFRALERALEARGAGNVEYFAYGPRIDWPRLAAELGDTIEAVRRTTDARRVDVVGHSLGGLVGRYLVEAYRGAPVRRLVTLGSPYFGSPMPANELALFGLHDPLVPLPDPVRGPHAPHLQPGGRVVLVPHCGHWGLLCHDTVMSEVVRFLTSPDLALTHGERRVAFDVAS